MPRSSLVVVVRVCVVFLVAVALAAIGFNHFLGWVLASKFLISKDIESIKLTRTCVCNRKCARSYAGAGEDSVSSSDRDGNESGLSHTRLSASIPSLATTASA